MNRRNEDSLEALVARSTLLPTAGEFIPQSFRQQSTPPEFNLPVNNGNQHAQDPVNSLQFNSRNQEKNYYRANNDRWRNSSGDARSWRDSREHDEWRESDNLAQGSDSRSDRYKHGGSSNKKNGYRGQRYQNNYRSDNRYYSQPPFARDEASSSNGARPRHPVNTANTKRSQNAPSSSRNYYSSHQLNQNYDPSQLDLNPVTDKGTTKFYEGNSLNNEPKFNSRKQSELDRDKNFQKDRYKREKSLKEVDKNQMEVLVGLLTRGTLECLVCCEHVKQTQHTWSCGVCHHVLHLRCVIKWALSSRADDGWRCPACQHVSITVPNDYLCFCGKTVDPIWNRSDCPHSCGSVCTRSRVGPCPHRCTLLCHPGPCPPCQSFNTRSCGCGRSSRTVQCSDLDPIVCGAKCEKTLLCGVHKCVENCHTGDCPPCSVMINRVCFCGESEKDDPCTKETANVTTFCCGKACKRMRNCGNHGCPLICHEGTCPPCTLLPQATQTCPCGKTKLTELSESTRISCLDPVPTCAKSCDKPLPCGEPGNRHVCINDCHEGPCPPCIGETSVRCRCGHMRKALPCAELAERGNDVRCEKKCLKLRSCGKHKCREFCCIDLDHICVLPCTRTLSCGLHQCEENCHSAYCKPCPRVSFEEMHCYCGSAVHFPPVPCGTAAPKCSLPCSRPQLCDHTPGHTCHENPDCPPCTALVSKKCHGGHELRKAVLCHVEAFSCGLPCGKPLPCGRHSCILPCHDGPCLKEGQDCTQPCTVARSTCGHPCNGPCHEQPCPDSPCKEMVKVTCECGHRFSTRDCVDNAKEYQRIAMSQLASKMADLAAGQTVNMNEVTSNSKKMSFKTLECTEECKVIERNRRLAVGLQIRNPDLSAKLTPRYSDFLRGWGKKDPDFCQMVHDKLTDLVQLAKQSKQKSRSFSFEPMRSDKRQFIFEYCEHFGCEAVAYDKEPKRNVVATALRDKSWLPGVSLLELLKGARKIPVPTNSKSVPSQKTMEVLQKKSTVAPVSAWATPRSSIDSPWRQVGDQPSASLSQSDFPNSLTDQPNSSNNSTSASNFDYFDMTNS